MKSFRTLLCSFVLTALVYGLYSWPLVKPANFFDKIPSAAFLPDELEHTSPEYMQSGDHLQLMYHFWLLSDYFTGQTRFLHNVYEFNNGDDDERKMINTHHFPFPILFRAVSAVAGRAAGWNVTSFVSLWLTFLFTWLLARRYVRSEWICALGSLVVILFPYRYGRLFEGSPEGFALMWTPLVWLGLEMVLRDRKWIGGLWAGIAILMTSFCDSHVFLFTLYFTPIMGLLSLMNMKQAVSTEAGESVAEAEPFDWRTRLFGLMAAGGGLGLAILYGLYKKQRMQAVGSGTERTFAEIKQYSVDYHHFLFGDGHVYMGFVLGLLILTGMILLFFFRRGEAIDPRRKVLGLVLSVGVLGIALLAMGTYAPLGLDDKIYRIVYDTLPMYKKIRQPTKIFGYMPLILAMLTVISLDQITRRIKVRAVGSILVLLCMLAVGAEYYSKMNVKACTLAFEQPAYEAVIADSEDKGYADPRSVVLPIFSGTLHNNSTYMHYASLYRLRMINGYYPVLRQNYYDNVYLPLKSFNYGVLPDAELDSLIERRIRYIIFHQDMYANNRSGMYTANLATQRLLNHPRLELLAQHREVITFRILPEPREHPAVLEQWNAFLPRLSYDAENGNLKQTGDRLSGAADAIGGGFVSLKKEGQVVQATPRSGRKFHAGVSPGLQIKLRVRGKGKAEWVMSGGPFPAAGKKREFLRKTFEVDSADWTWVTVDLSAEDLSAWMVFSIEHLEGAVDIDYFKWSGVSWEDLAVGQAVNLPIAAFEHKGFVDVATGELVYHPYFEPGGQSILSPPVVLSKGKYELALAFTNSDVKKGTPLFSLYASSKSAPLIFNLPVVSGSEAKATVTLADDFPVRFKLHFDRNAEIRMGDLSLKRVE
jgi:hypothetical protein